MAARLNKRHQAMVRKKIQCSQLLNLLQDHALNGSDVDESRLKRAEFLLKLAVPPLKPEDAATGDTADRLIIQTVAYGERPDSE